MSRFVNDAVVVVGMSMLVISINDVFGDCVVVSFLHELLVGNFVVNNRLVNHFMVHNWLVVERHLSVFSNNMLLDGFFDNFLDIANLFWLSMLRVFILVGSHVSVGVLAVNHVVGRVQAPVVARVVLTGHLNLNVNVVHANLSAVHGRNVLFLHGCLNDPPSVVGSVLVGRLPVRIVNVGGSEWLSSLVMLNDWHFHVVSCCVRVMVAVVVRSRGVMVRDFLYNADRLFLVVLNDRLVMLSNQHGLFKHFVVHDGLMLNHMARFLINVDNTLSVMSVVVDRLMVDGLLVLVSVHMMHILFHNDVIVIKAVLLFPILQGRLLVAFQEFLEVEVAINVTLVVRVVIRQVNRFVDGVLDPRMRRNVMLVVIVMVQFGVGFMVHDGDWSFVVLNMRVNHIRVVFWLVVSIRVTIVVRFLHNNRFNMNGLFMTYNCFVVDHRFVNDVDALIFMVQWLSFDLSDNSVRVLVHHRLNHLSSEVFNHGWLVLLSHSVRSSVSRFVVMGKLLLINGLLNNVGAIVGLRMMSSLVVISLVKDFFDEFELAVPVSILRGEVFLGVMCGSSQINGVFFLLVVAVGVVARRVVTVLGVRLLNFIHDLVRRRVLAPQVSVIGKVFIPGRFMVSKDGVMMNSG